MNQKLTYLLFVIFLGVYNTSCTKDEGYGGKATIRGTVKERVYDKNFSAFQSESVATNKDVYIEFGDNQTVADDVKTSANGTFEFNYLLPGKYRIYIYSEDSANHNTNKITVIKEIEISKDDKTIDLGDIVSYKTIDYDDGKASILGTVKKRIYDVDFSVFQNENAAMDEDVYIESVDNLYFRDDVKTSANGSFNFYNLLPGTYRIYIYSEDSANHNTNKIPIVKEIEISKDDKTIDIGDIVSYKTIDYDEGTSMVKGVIGGFLWTRNFNSPIIYFNQVTQKMDTIKGYAQDYDVYLVYKSKSGTETRARTLYDGSYCFPNLIKGKYQLFTYRYTMYLNETIIKDFEITEDNQIIPIDSISVNIETNI